MNASELLNQIRNSGKVTDADGAEHDFHSSIDVAEGELLQRLIEKHKPQKTIEIGCAFGTSSLYICDALNRFSERPEHTIIDPFQHENWHGVGLHNLHRCKLDFFKHVSERSELALPKILESGGPGQFDFALIDGFHTFDHTLLDIFYLTRMLKTGGILVIDDIRMPGVNLAARYALKYPCYRMLDKATFSASKSLKRIWFVFEALQKATWLVPKRRLFFRSSVLAPDRKLGTDSTMIAIQKVSDDERNWDWFEPF